MHGFDIFDERVVVVGTETATAFLSDRRDVEAYLKLFGDLQRLAAFGAEAWEELQRAAQVYPPGL